MIAVRTSPWRRGETSENAPFLCLHQRHGFQRAGYERQVAFKLDRWLDVVTLQPLL